MDTLRSDWPDGAKLWLSVTDRRELSKARASGESRALGRDWPPITSRRA